MGAHHSHAVTVSQGPDDVAFPHRYAAGAAAAHPGQRADASAAVSHGQPGVTNVLDCVGRAILVCNFLCRHGF